MSVATDSTNLVSEEELWQTVESIWASMLDMPIARCEEPVAEPEDDVSMTGCLQITGNCEIAVLVESPGVLAKKMGASMFGVPLDEVTREETLDALGEVSNMVGGNIKNLLPGICELSLPCVTEGADYAMRVPGADVSTRLFCESEGMPLNVLIVTKRDSAERTGDAD